MWRNELYGNLTPSEFKMGQDFGRNLGASIVKTPEFQGATAGIIKGAFECGTNPTCYAKNALTGAGVASGFNAFFGKK